MREKFKYTEIIYFFFINNSSHHYNTLMFTNLRTYCTYCSFYFGKRSGTCE